MYSCKPTTPHIPKTPRDKHSLNTIDVRLSFAPIPKIEPSLPRQTDLGGGAFGAASGLGRCAGTQGWESRQKRELTLKTWIDRSQRKMKNRKGVGKGPSEPAAAPVPAAAAW